MAKQTRLKDFKVLRLLVAGGLLLLNSGKRQKKETIAKESITPVDTL